MAASVSFSCCVGFEDEITAAMATDMREGMCSAVAQPASDGEIGFEEVERGDLSRVFRNYVGTCFGESSSSRTLPDGVYHVQDCVLAYPPYATRRGAAHVYLIAAGAFFSTVLPVSSDHMLTHLRGAPRVRIQNIQGTSHYLLSKPLSACERVIEEVGSMLGAADPTSEYGHMECLDASGACVSLASRAIVLATADDRLRFRLMDFEGSVAEREHELHVDLQGSHACSMLSWRTLFHVGHELLEVQKKDGTSRFVNISKSVAWAHSVAIDLLHREE